MCRTTVTNCLISARVSTREFVTKSSRRRPAVVSPPSRDSHVQKLLVFEIIILFCECIFLIEGFIFELPLCSYVLQFPISNVARNNVTRREIAITVKVCRIVIILLQMFTFATWTLICAKCLTI